MERIRVILIVLVGLLAAGTNFLCSAQEKDQRPILKDERPSPAEYWQKIRNIASKELAIKNIELELNTGYSYYFEKGTEYPGNNINVGFKFPLYSAKEKNAKRDMAVKFQQEGAKLIADLEGAQVTKKLYIDELPWLKMRREDGIEAAREYLDIQRKIVEQDALIAKAHRELQALIEPFGGTAEIKSTEIQNASYMGK